MPQENMLIESNYLCHKCIGEYFLKEKIKLNGKSKKCNYCNKRFKGFPIEAIAELVDDVFQHHYRKTASEPSSWEYHLINDDESDYEWEREGTPIIYAIMEAVEVSEKIATDIQEFLENKHFDFEMAKYGAEGQYSKYSYYEENIQTGEEWQSIWHSFEQSLRSKSRYFSQNAQQVLTSIFDRIDEMHTHSGKALIINAGVDTDYKSFYRARVFQSEEKLLDALKHPDYSLGTPPSDLAIAGRMNAHGISVFYGATEAKVAIAEVRPPVGSKVVVARFQIIKSLRLLDLSALEGIVTRGSIFDPQYVKELRRVAFLKTLCKKITKPVMPNDEHFNYLATQAVSDFLATQTNFLIDGILFPSVQVEGDVLNIVLFNKASQVEYMDIPEGAEIEVDTNDSWFTGYSVIEWLSEEDDNSKSSTYKTSQPQLVEMNLKKIRKSQDATLKIDINSIKVHYVKKAHYETEIYSVSRDRFSK